MNSFDPLMGRLDTLERTEGGEGSGVGKGGGWGVGGGNRVSVLYDNHL